MGRFARAQHSDGARNENHLEACHHGLALVLEHRRMSVQGRVDQGLAPCHAALARARAARFLATIGSGRIASAAVRAAKSPGTELVAIQPGLLLAQPIRDAHQRKA
jgi:hypothetical protein